MRNPASDPFALGGDAGLSPEEIEAAAPVAIHARENARMIVQAVFGTEADVTGVTVNVVTGIEVETSMIGDFFLIEVSLQTPRGELLPCLTFLNRDEAAAAFNLGKPDDGAEWSDQIDRLNNPADLIVEALNAHLTAGGSTCSFARPSVRVVGLPDDAASLLLATDEPLLELTYTLSVEDVGDVSAVTIAALDLVRRLGDDAGMPAAAGAPPARQGSGRSPESLLEQAAEIFGTPPAAQGRGRGAPAGGGGMTYASTQGSSAGMGADPAAIRPAQFQQFGGESDRETLANIDLIMDVNLRVSVQLGQSRMTIREILDLGPGFVIELDKLAGEPVDILVNDKPIARGEVVVVDENFGVRVVDIISPQKRVASLR